MSWPVIYTGSEKMGLHEERMRQKKRAREVKREKNVYRNTVPDNPFLRTQWPITCTHTRCSEHREHIGGPPTPKSPFLSPASNSLWGEAVLPQNIGGGALGGVGRELDSHHRKNRLIAQMAWSIPSTN